MRHVYAVLRRLDSLVVRRRVRDYSWIVMALCAAALVWNIAAGDYPLAATRDVVLPDFQARWTGARLVLEGRTDVLYDPLVQRAVQESVPGTVGLSWFVSPPTTALLYLPYGLMPYPVAVAVRGLALLVLLAASVFEAGRLVPGLKDYRVLALAFLASPPVLQVLITGQDSFGVTLVFVVAIGLLLRGRDIGAGAVLGLGVFKPHLFVLVPLALLVQRRWKAVAACGCVALVLVAATMPVVGISGWRAWVDVLGSEKFQAGVQGGQAWLMQGLPSLLTELGSPHWVGYPILGFGVVVLALRLRGETDTLRLWALTLLATMVLSAHVLSYDLVFLLPVLAYVAREGTTRAIRLTSIALVLVLWTAVPRHILVEIHPHLWLLGVPWSAVLLAAVSWQVYRLGAREEPAREALRQAPGNQVADPA